MYLFSILSAQRFLFPYSLTCCLLLIAFCIVPIAPATADEPAAASKDEDNGQPPSTRIEIPDEPQRIDPATLLPEKLAANVTVEFQERSLSEVAEWIEQEQKLDVFLDRRALNEAGILTSEPISDSLTDDPLYLLLNRLRTAGLSWYLRDGNVFITTVAGAKERLSTQHYNIGHLLDAGFDTDRLTATLTGTVAPESWEELGGTGSYVLLGDVLFVRQSDSLQRQVEGLLAAFRNHGRRTFILDASQNEQLRQKMDENVSVSMKGVPLVEGIGKLSDVAEIPIRIDRNSLRESGIRERTPITLELAEQKLRTALLAVLHELDATWVIRDGLVWIVSQEHAEAFTKTAVYDVRDLCRDFEESNSLRQAIENQASPEDWESLGGIGTMRFPRPGMLVVYQTERNHDAVLQLLERYRLALRSSKPRKREKLDPKDVITRYYRMPTAIASDLRVALPELLRPETWRSEGQSEAPGTVLQLTSRPELLDAQGYEIKDVASENPQGAEPAVVVDHSVLVIRQMREVHEEIPEILQRIEQGDRASEAFSAEAAPSGMDGMGGFGGGFF